MSIKTTCLACGHVFHVKDEFAGIKAKCSDCGAVVQVPAAAAGSSAQLPTAKPPAAAPAAPRSAKPPAARRPAASDSAAAAPPPREEPSQSSLREKLLVPTPGNEPAPASPKDKTGVSSTPERPAAPGIVPQINVGHEQESVTSRVGQAARHGRRPAKNPNTVLMAAVIVLAVALVGTAGIGLLAWSGAFGGPEITEEERAWAHEGKVVVPDWKTDTPTPDPARPTENDPNRTRPDRIEPVDYEDGLNVGDSAFVRDFDRLKDAVVKFEIPLANGTGKAGTGFFVDKRGWVATNYHVIDGMTTDARVKMANNDRYRIEGIIAQARERDLAVVKLAEKPYQVMLLDTESYVGEPRIGQDVFSFGHPLGNEFSLTKGIVSRVLSSSEIRQAHPRHIINDINAPGGQIWIQHQAKISQGNSGGPLLNKDCQVIGVNSFGQEASDLGFAAHVQHLRQMIAEADGVATPLPKGKFFAEVDEDAPPPQLPAIEIEKLCDQCKAFGWKPGSSEQYATMARLAGAMATANGTADEMATTVFADMQAVEWSDEMVKSVNKFAKERMNKGNQGIVLVGEVTTIQRDYLFAKVGDAKMPVFVQPISDRLSGAQQGNKILIVGLVHPDPVLVANVIARMINSRHMCRLEAGN
jgi:S1-C subfamily serine protease